MQYIYVKRYPLHISKEPLPTLRCEWWLLWQPCSCWQRSSLKSQPPYPRLPTSRWSIFGSSSALWQYFWSLFSTLSLTITSTTPELITGLLKCLGRRVMRNKKLEPFLNTEQEVARLRSCSLLSSWHALWLVAALPSLMWFIGACWGCPLVWCTSTSLTEMIYGGHQGKIYWGNGTRQLRKRQDNRNHNLLLRVG